MIPEITKSDFAGIGNIATHCNNSKLQIAINEAKQFDLKPLLCDWYGVAVDNWESEDPEWSAAINGGTYENCSGNDFEFAGLFAALKYFAYARYIVLNNYDDTPNGGVTKTNEWSVPKPLKELQAFSDKYRVMAMQIWKDTKGYLCSNKDILDFNHADCSDCGCGSGCGDAVNTKGFGLKSTNVGRYGLR